MKGPFKVYNPIISKVNRFRIWATTFQYNQYRGQSLGS